MTLAWQLVDAVLSVTATTPRKSVGCEDRWFTSPSLELDREPVGDTSAVRRSTRVSRVTVGQSSLAIDTTYALSYAIVMRTGERAWAGSGSLTLTVGGDGLLIEIAVGGRSRCP